MRTIHGKDRVQSYYIGLIELMSISCVGLPLIVFLHDYLSLWYLLAGFVLVNYVVSQGFTYRISLVQDTVEINRYFYKYEYYKNTFEFKEISTNKVNWITFKSADKRLTLDAEAGFEGGFINGSLHIDQNDVESIEIGDKNSGVTIISTLLNEFDETRRNS